MNQPNPCNPDVAAALHTLSLVRALLDKYEAALSSGARIPSYGLCGTLSRRALNFSYAELAQAWNAELANVPVGAPAPPPAPKPAAVPEAERWVVDEGQLFHLRKRFPAS